MLVEVPGQEPSAAEVALLTGDDAGQDVLDHHIAATLRADRFTAFGVAADKVDPAGFRRLLSEALPKLSVQDRILAEIGIEFRDDPEALDKLRQFNMAGTCPASPADLADFQAGCIDDGGICFEPLAQGRAEVFADFPLDRLTTKAGVDMIHRRNRSNTEDQFNGLFEFASLADFRAGTPTTYTVSSGNPLLEVTQLEGAAFLQNDVRLSPRLTMMLGLRYEAQTNLDDWNNLDPRFGYGETDTTVEVTPLAKNRKAEMALAVPMPAVIKPIHMFWR